MSEPNTNFITPILFIGFNRLDTAERVFEVIRQIKPNQLFFAVDAPRPDRQEAERCQRVRDLIKKVDWDCEVKTYFPATNMGARAGVSSAISWFFDQVEEGIILEHDCLPDLSFFKFCQELLIKYRDETKVMQISGNCFLPEVKNDSYYFSHIPHIWGWATWRRAWKHYDVDMKDFPEFKKEHQINTIFKDKLNQTKWEYLFEKVYLKKAETWDYQFAYAILRQGGLSIIPKVNLVSNIGFGQDSLHSQDESSPFANVPALKIDFPLKHPMKLEVDYEADVYISKHNFSFGWGKYALMKTGLFYLIQKIYLTLKQ